MWSTASPLRKQEWLTLLADIVSHELPWSSRAPYTLIVGSDDTHFRFVFGEGAEDMRTLARADIAPIVNEYVGVIKKLSQRDLQDAHITALDMAKRVVHDAGARRIGALLPDASPSLETRRRLFSLLVSLAVDTTRLGGISAHGSALRHRRA